MLHNLAKVGSFESTVQFCLTRCEHDKLYTFRSVCEVVYSRPTGYTFHH